ncbi:phospholipase SGR2-like isoform X2 [Euphorbia lathyris]|uniref:phospholipase SGR2-like isoform X2 n=1 Tax=Euphorbia lathyris TaxID=212925 RepID=UPI0033141694
MAGSTANLEISEEISPDLLKNTPSNIARLEDVIEHSEGRQKYLAQTTSPSDGSDVRWYFCKVPLAMNELAASIPRSEIVGKGDYFRFGMRDSLAIEASFLQREEELLSSWWKEYAECSEGPRGQLATNRKLDMRKSAYSLEGVLETQLYEVEEERVGVPVKGGLFEVDLVRRHCFPVYWNGENRRVLRGHWFARKGGLDWLPLREDVAEQLEVAYRGQVWRRRTFQPSGLFAARVNLQGYTPGLHALFMGEDNNWEAWLNVDASGFSSIISFGGNGVKLRRGYSASQANKPTQDELRQQKEEEIDDYCSQVPVRHVVFMIHGIGQRLEKSNLVDDVGDFRHLTSSLAEQHLTSYQRGSQRVLFIPCQWRKGLKLSGETAVDKITLHGVRGLRVTLGATVHDVLYYMSPIYCQNIIDSVSNQLNCLYLKFIKRNPGYNGKVSIYAHSLGSVLSYDILCHQENLYTPFPMDWMYSKHTASKESPHAMNDQSSACGSPINLEVSNPSVLNEALEEVDPIDGDGMREQSTRVQADTNAEDASTILNRHVSDLEQLPAVAVVLEQRLGEIADHDNNSCDVLLWEGNHLVEDIGTTFDDEINCSDRIPSENCNNAAKDKAINLLREEIDSLKAKIAELESQCGYRDAIVGLCQADSTSTKPLSEKLPPRLDDEAPKNYTPCIKYTKLEFKVDTFFAVGSPLGVFLALRNIRIGIGEGKEYWAEENIIEELPACRQMFNIFHPFDPVAYRVEPLVCKEYVDKRPVIIPYHRGGKRLHISFQEFREDLAARSQAVTDKLNFVKIKVLTVCQSRMDSLEDEAENDGDEEQRTYGSLMMERLTGSEEGRIDHMLQDKTFEHPYLQALGSHTNYWRDCDTALFILNHLYKDIPEEAKSPKGSSLGNTKEENISTGWFDQREVEEEDLPLTFSDRMMVRNFSSKAKKFMNNY